MKTAMRADILVTILYISFTTYCAEGSGSDASEDYGAHRRLLLILMDGVRWDQVMDPELQGFAEIIRSGVRAEHMEPAFPSDSHTNYYAIATG